MRYTHSVHMTFTHGGTRTRNLCLRRAAPYPLGHASTNTLGVLVRHIIIIIIFYVLLQFTTMVDNSSSWSLLDYFTMIFLVVPKTHIMVAHIFRTLIDISFS